MAVHQQHPPRALPSVFTRITMKSTIACLLVLAVVAQAQFYGYGLGAGYGGYYGNYGAYPFGGVRATTAYTGIPATATVPAAYPVAYGYPSYTATQYHAQDELGQASFGYAHPGQAASNMRDAFGNQIGSYAYINPENQEVRVSYTADSRGFRVLSNNLPVAPAQIVDTPEVSKAKADHAAAFAAAKSGVAPVAPVTPAVALPAPVQDTPEVAAAKAEFAVKFAAAKAGRAKRQVFGYGASPFAYPGYAVSPYGYSVAAPAVYAAPAMPVREATLTKVIHTPGHAASYRVD